MIDCLSLHVFGMHFNRFQLVLAPERAAVAVMSWQGCPRRWKETRSADGELRTLVANAVHGLPASARIDVAFADHWARYLFFPVAADALSLEEARTLASDQFDAVYPELRGGEWPMRLAAGAGAMLAARVDPDMLDAVRAGITAGGQRVGRLEPVLAYALNRDDTGLAGHTGWWLLAEDDLVLCVQLRLGLPVGIHSRRGNPAAEAAILLERQQVLSGFDRTAVKLTGLFRNVTVRLPDAWQSTATPPLVDHGPGGVDAA